MKLKKYLYTFMAVNLIGISIALILESGLGCEPIGLFCEGISKFFSIKFGIASFFYNTLTIGFSLFFIRNNLGIGTISYGLLSGFFIDFYREIFIFLNLKESNTIILILAFIIGELFMSSAFAILMQLDLGMTALDTILIKIKVVTKLPYSFIKIGIDIILVGMGIFLGGTFGLGTVISALITGVLVEKIGNFMKMKEIKKINKGDVLK